MADAGSASTGGENPVNNQDLCGFCHNNHEIEACLAAKICTGLMHHASLHMAKMVQETQAAANRGERSSGNSSAEEVCLYCCVPGHDIFGCLMTRCVAIMICQLSGVGPKQTDPFGAGETATEADNEAIPEAVNEVAPEVITEAVPETTNEAVPETTNEAITEAVPETSHGTTKPEDSEKKSNETARPKSKPKRKWKWKKKKHQRTRKAANDQPEVATEKESADNVASAQTATEWSEAEANVASAQTVTDWAEDIEPPV